MLPIRFTTFDNSGAEPVPACYRIPTEMANVWSTTGPPPGSDDRQNASRLERHNLSEGALEADDLLQHRCRTRPFGLIGTAWRTRQESRIVTGSQPGVPKAVVSPFYLDSRDQDKHGWDARQSVHPATVPAHQQRRSASG